VERDDLAGTPLEEDSRDSAASAGQRDRWRTDRVRNVARSTIARQAAGFAGASLTANGLALVATAILTRNLSTGAFGNYSFAVSFLFFVALFFEFGLFQPAARLAAVSGSQERREVVGAALLAYLPVGLAFSGTVLVLSFWVDDWFNVDAANTIRVAAVPAIAFPFYFVLQQLAQGMDRLHIASIATVLAQLVLVVLLTIQVAIGEVTTSSALVFRALGLLVAGLLSAFALRPLFAETARWARVFVQHARQWGFQVFVGRVLSIGTYNMDILMLGIWTSSRSVGMYALAGSIATASGFPVVGFSSALYGRMARSPAIERRWLVRSLSIGIPCMVAAWLLAAPVIRIFFSPRYEAAAALVLPLALAQLVRGTTGIFNTFLTAHGRGTDLRNAGLVLTLSNVAFNFLLIPSFGASGAAWASLLALGANLVAHVVFYRRSFTL
jgi:O-antigen/teichoic acid export membrane protein